MNYTSIKKYCTILLLLISSSITKAGIQITPSYLFLDGSRRSIPVNVSNTGNDEREVWVEIKFGYEMTDDSGKFYIHLDSLDANEPSAAHWLQCFPKRFLLGPGESQTIRILAVPPAGIAEGEYWARIQVVSKPREKAHVSSQAAQNVKPGITILYQQSLPFHYRVGNPATGLEVDTLITAASDTNVTVSMLLTRKGNASYWGSRTIKVLDKNGKVVLNQTKNTGIYKTIRLTDSFSKLNLQPGNYIVEVEFSTDKRRDVPKASLIHALPVRVTSSFIIP